MLCTNLALLRAKLALLRTELAHLASPVGILDGKPGLQNTKFALKLSKLALHFCQFLAIDLFAHLGLQLGHRSSDFGHLLRDIRRSNFRQLELLSGFSLKFPEFCLSAA